MMSIVPCNYPNVWNSALWSYAYLGGANGSHTVCINWFGSQNPLGTDPYEWRGTPYTPPDGAIRVFENQHQTNRKIEFAGAQKVEDQP